MSSKKLQRFSLPPLINSCLVCCLVCVCMLAVSEVEASGLLRDSIGSVPAGRGGTNLTHWDNLSVINDNPAGLARTQADFWAEAGGIVLKPAVKYREPGVTQCCCRQWVVSPHAAISGRIPPWGVAFGLNVFYPADYEFEYKLRHDVFGDSLYESKGSLLKVLPAVSVQLTDRISVGGGVGFGYGRTYLKLPYTFHGRKLKGESGIIKVRTEGYGPTANAGIQVKATDRLILGASFTSQTLTKQEGDFSVDFSGTGTVSSLGLDSPKAKYDCDFNHRWPAVTAAGASYRFNWARFSVEWLWYNWDEPFEEYEFRLSDGNNPKLNEVTGSKTEEAIPLARVY